MKTVSVYYERAEDQSIEEFNEECKRAFNADRYNESLKQIADLLTNYDKSKQLSKPQKSLLDDIRKRCYPLLIDVLKDK